MSEPGSITVCLKQLEEGNGKAVQQLWNASFAKLVHLARRKLQGLPSYRMDPEDLALSAFESLCLGAQRKRFPRLADRRDLWQILLMLTRNKAANLRDYHRSAKRDYRREVAQANPADDPAEGDYLFASHEPDPALAAAGAEQYQQLLQRLPNEQLRQIAARKLEGFSNEEIAAALHCAPTTVERKLARIRRCWRNHRNNAL